MAERIKIGALLSAVGGILIFLISIDVARSELGWLIIYAADAPWYAMLLQGIGFFTLFFGILVTVGGAISFKKHRAFVGGMLSLAFSGLSAITGILFWLSPFYNATTISIVGATSLFLYHIFSAIGVEAYAHLFFLGVILGVAGGGVTIAATKRIG